MTIPNTDIGLSGSIQTEFGGTAPTGLSEYYRGGAYVPSTVAQIPASGSPIAFSNFKGVTKPATVYGSLTVTATILQTITIDVSLAGGTPPAGTYYWRFGSFTGGVTSSGFAATSGSFSISNNTGAFSVSTTFDSATISNGSFTVDIGTTNGFTTAVATASFAVYNQYTLQVVRTGGTSYGQAVTLVANIAKITASSAARGIKFQTSVDNINFYDKYSGTIPASTTSWSATIFSNTNPTFYSANLYIRALIANHPTRSASFTNIYT